MELSNDPIHDALAKADQIAGILKKCVDEEKLTDAEQQQLDYWLSDSPYHPVIHADITDPDILEKDIKSMVAVDRKALWDKIMNGIVINANEG